MADTTKEAYRIVLNDILNNGCEMFVGNYDAKNDSAEYMYGISAVMEYIAYSICDEQGDDFSNLFIKNMIASEQKTKGIKCYKCAELDSCYKGQHGGKKKIIKKSLTNNKLDVIIIIESEREVIQNGWYNKRGL